VDRLDSSKKTISFSPLLVSDEEGKNTKIGTPTLDDLKVDAKIVDGEVRGEKIKVFKMKAKKRYARTQGFRAALTLIEITSIPGDAPKKASTASAAKKAPAKKTTTPAAKKSTSTAKKAPAKKTTKTAA